MKRRLAARAAGLTAALLGADSLRGGRGRRGRREVAGEGGHVSVNGRQVCEKDGRVGLGAVAELGQMALEETPGP